ncbi:MAG: acyl carrier protein [Planctomycetes bacterium]|nr:acyl carrier protein [Planctomycetota bacterium]
MPVSDALVLRIKQMLIRQLKLKVTPEEIEDSSPLFGEDPGGLGLDSIDVLEVVASIEKEFGVQIRTQEEGERVLRSVAALAEFLAAKGVR